MTEIEGEGGGDPTNAIRVELEQRGREYTRDAAHLWYQESTDWLRDAAERRAEVGLAHGRAGRAGQGLDQIRLSSVPPTWEKEEEAWVFSFPHRGAVFQEFGAMPHEIRAKRAEALAFEWPDAPEEVKEQFEHTEGDLVFFESVDHPGIPAIGFVRYGRDRAQAFLRRHGHSTEVYKS